MEAILKVNGIEDRGEKRKNTFLPKISEMFRLISECLFKKRSLFETSKFFKYTIKVYLLVFFPSKFSTFQSKKFVFFLEHF